MQNKSDQSSLAGWQVPENANTKVRNGIGTRDVVYCEQTQIYNNNRSIGITRIMNASGIYIQCYTGERGSPLKFEIGNF